MCHSAAGWKPAVSCGGQIPRRTLAICRNGAPKPPNSVFRRVATDANMLTGILWHITDTRGILLQSATFLAWSGSRYNPGNRPNEEKHNFYRTVVRIYEEAAEDPRNPQKDRITGALSGEVLDMLQACLEPLDVPDSRSVIYETYYRAGAKLTTKKPWWEHFIDQRIVILSDSQD